jgi:RHS repeat-associated protein
MTKYLVFLLTILYATGNAQNLTGPTTVSVGQILQYSFNDGVIYSTNNWQFSGGVANGSSWRSGTTYYINVEWTTQGAGFVKFYGGNNLQLKGTLNVTINTSSCTVPSAPGVTLTSLNESCSSVTLQHSGTPPSDIQWYWQTSPTGTSTANATSTYIATASGTYYLRAKRNCGAYWSAGYSQITVTVNVIPDQPASIIVSTNTCGDKTLSKSGTPPANVGWYWQGNQLNGTDYTSSLATAATYIAASSDTYVLRARSSSGCWSSPGGSSASKVDVTVNKPAGPPQMGTFTKCEWETIKLSSPGNTNSNMNWYTTTGQYLFNGPYYTKGSMNVGEHTYVVRNVGGAGCVSTESNLVILTVKSNCDEYINWNQTDAFKTDDINSSPYVVASSREYYDGFGSELQSQGKSFSTDQVIATQPVYDARGNASMQTLPAPINSSSFAYRTRFITNSNLDPYSAGDFDARINTGASGEVNNPKAVGNNGIGSLGHYYSSSNTTEPNTPVTSYPFSRVYQPEGPDPTMQKGAGPGDVYRMGAGHETISERQTFLSTDISHYYSLRKHFTQEPEEVLYTGSTPVLEEFVLLSSAASTISAATVNGEPYAKVTVDKPTIPGFISNLSYSVSPGDVLSVRFFGFRSDATAANLYVKDVTNNVDLVWPGNGLPLGSANAAQVEDDFVIPANCTQIKVGVRFNGATMSSVGHAFYTKQVQLVKKLKKYTAGYKITSTDGNGKKSVNFFDAENKALASATLDGSTYDNWSYNYYNATGQLIATVAPNGVVTSSSAYPKFVSTYRYDHLGRLIETISTDQGKTQYAYDIDGRIRFSQNNEQRIANPQRFSYTNYDYLGRLVESGEYTCSGSSPFVFQTHDATPVANSVLSVVENKVSDIETTSSSNYVGVSAKVDNTRCEQYTFIKYDSPGSGFQADANHTVLENLLGQVAYTTNGANTTWYSYDEFGQVSWTKQNLEGLGAKTIDYTYDFAGNVKEVAYQKGQPDAFYHYYFYDADQRLIEVQTSKDALAKTTRAKYQYYLHGPLKRAELMNGSMGVQGLDYVYAVDGSLKSINNADPTRDPGQDGIGGPNASFTKDVFGSTFFYNDSDYTGAAYNAGTQTIDAAFPNQFNGLPKAISWHNAVDNNKPRTYGYKYDNVYQFSEAKFGDFTTGQFNQSGPDQFKESIGGYDKNGNISSLLRKDKHGAVIGNYSYAYEANTNKLDRVDNNGSLMLDYSYNSIGQMTTQTEGAKALNIKYNITGLVSEIRDGSSQLLTSYHYDDRGNLFRKVRYNNGSAISATYFVSDGSGNVVATYESSGGAPTLIEVPVYGSGRLALYKPLIDTYLYEIGDHLGNVRAVIGMPDTHTIIATMESENASNEQPPFKNITETRVVSIAANHTTSGDEAVRLNNTKPAGPSIVIPVSSGDKLDISSWAYYEGSFNGTNNLTEASIITAIASSFGGVQGAGGESGAIYDRVNSGLTGIGGGGTNSSPAPMASVRYMVYDINHVFRYGGVTSVNTASNMAKAKITQPQIVIDEPGYIYICLYNQSDSPNWVYFDDLEIIHQYSPIVAGADYYPFGMEMEGRQIMEESYRYGYQGQFSEKDLTTGMNEFELRMYDSRIGRWISPDPYGQFASPYVGMGNNPVMGVDPDGGWWCCGPGAAKGASGLAGAGAAAAGIGPAAGAAIGSAVMNATAGAVRGVANSSPPERSFVKKEIDNRSWFYKNVLEPATDKVVGINRGLWGWAPEFNSGNTERDRDRYVGEKYLAPVVGTVFSPRVPNPGGYMPQRITPNGVTVTTSPVGPPKITVPRVHMSGKASAASYKFPSADELAKLLSVKVNEFHTNIKPLIKRDFAKEMKRIGTTNPDIGLDNLGNIILKNPSTGVTVETGIPLSAYIP